MFCTTCVNNLGFSPRFVFMQIVIFWKYNNTVNVPLFGFRISQTRKSAFGCSLWRSDSKVKLGVVNHSSVKMKLLHFHLSRGVWRSQTVVPFFGERVFWFLSCWYSQGTSYQFFLIFVDRLRSHIIPSISSNHLLFSLPLRLDKFWFLDFFPFWNFHQIHKLVNFSGDHLLDSFPNVHFPLGIFIFLKIISVLNLLFSFPLWKV